MNIKFLMQMNVAKKIPALTLVKKENEKEEDMAEMAQSMQQQMLFIMPVMTGFFALSFPSGLALYWVATTVLSIGQQYAVSGFGGFRTYGKRALALIKK